MKKILIILVAALFAVMASCKKDIKATISSTILAPVLSSPASGTAIVVTTADSSQNLTITWSKADYGVASVINYFVQVDSAGKNYSKFITLGTTSNDTLTHTNGLINRLLLNKLNFAPNAASTIEIRVGATLAGKDTVYSKPVNLSFTTFKELAPPRLYVPGAYQGWNPGAAPTILPVTTFTYEGYVYMNIGDYFKFTSAPDFSHINYGDAGSGKLSTDGNAAGLKVNAAGYYKLNADIQNLSYSTALISSFGIIGSATAQGWNSSTPMTYDQVKNVWVVTAALVPGALKFRANDAWSINYGPKDINALTGTLIQTNDAITISAAGNYTVTIDMSQSTQKNYIYTVVKN